MPPSPSPSIRGTPGAARSAVPTAGVDPPPAGPGDLTTAAPDIPLLILGIGNSIRTDDGVGVHAVTALRDDPQLPAGTEVVDGGTSGLALLPTIAEARALILVDAVDVGAPAGSVHVLRGADLYADLVHLSVHQVGAADLLAAATLTGTLPRQVVLVGVQPASLAPGTRLSDAVAAALPEAIGTVRQWCRRLTSQPAAG